MPKYCGYCGTKNQDYANVCANCGAPFVNNSGTNISPSNITTQGNYGTFNGNGAQNDTQNLTGVISPVKKNKKLPLIATGVAIAIIALIVVVIVNINTSDETNRDDDTPSIESQIKTAIKNEDVDKLCKLQSYIIDDIEEEEIKECYSNILEDIYDFFDEKFDGEDYTVSCKYDNDKKKEYNDEKAAIEIQDLFNLDDDEAEDYEDCSVKKLRLEVIGKCGNKDKDVDLTVYLIEGDDDWELLYIYLDY